MHMLGISVLINPSQNLTAHDGRKQQQQQKWINQINWTVQIENETQRRVLDYNHLNVDQVAFFQCANKICSRNSISMHMICSELAWLLLRSHFFLFICGFIRQSVLFTLNKCIKIIQACTKARRERNIQSRKNGTVNNFQPYTYLVI